MAQAGKLVGVAQLVSLDDLVRGDAEGPVYRGLVRAAARHLSRAAGPAGIVVTRSGHHFAIAGIGGILRVVCRTVRRRTLHRRLRPGRSAFPLALVFAFGLFAALLFFALR